MRVEERKETHEQKEPKPIRRFDFLWWTVIFVPIVWWLAMLVLVLMGKKIGWHIFLSTGFIIQGCLYGFMAVLRMLIKPLGRGYKKGHHIAFLIAGLFWAVLGIIVIFVTKGL